MGGWRTIQSIKKGSSSSRSKLWQGSRIPLLPSGASLQAPRKKEKSPKLLGEKHHCQRPPKDPNQGSGCWNQAALPRADASKTSHTLESYCLTHPFLPGSQTEMLLPGKVGDASYQSTNQMTKTICARALSSIKVCPPLACLTSLLA